jgi:hypothetical protein
VTLPLLTPALISAFFIAFTLSFDEYAIASFLAGSEETWAGLSVRPAPRAEPVASTDRRVLRRVYRVDAAHPFGRDRPAHRATPVRTGILCTGSRLDSLSHIASEPSVPQCPSRFIAIMTR